jgi:hypothetical protein
MLEARGASNAKARERVGSTARHSTWREGFTAELIDGLLAARGGEAGEPTPASPTAGPAARRRASATRP